MRRAVVGVDGYGDFSELLRPLFQTVGALGEAAQILALVDDLVEVVRLKPTT